MRVTAVALVVALVNSVPAPSNSQDQFAAFGLSGDSVSAFLTRLQAAVRRRDTVVIASMIRYPLSVNEARLHHGIRSRREFLASYGSVFTPQVSEVIIGQRFDNLFVNWQGVMVGEGQLWFSGICDTDKCEHSRLRIITVNRDAPLPQWLRQAQRRQ